MAKSWGAVAEKALFLIPTWEAILSGGTASGPPS